MKRNPSSDNIDKFTEFLWVPASHIKWVFWCVIGKYGLRPQVGLNLITCLLKWSRIRRSHDGGITYICNVRTLERYTVQEPA
jgi:hypothetical protein